MSDRNQHIDKAFTDHSWSEMRKLLDAEMPAAAPARKRRFAGWWWTAALLLLSGTGAFALYLNNEKKPLAPVSALPEAPIAKVTQGSSEQSLVSAASEKSLPQGTQDSQGSEQSLVSAAPKKPAVQVPTFRPFVEKDGQNNTRQNTSVLSEVLSKSASPTSTDVPKRIENQQNTNAVAAQITSSPTPPLLQKSGANEPARLPVPALLETKSSELLASGMAPVNKLKTSVITPTKSKISFSLYAAAQRALPGSSDGVALGMNLNKRLGKSKFSVETGIGYAFSRQPIGILVDNSTAPEMNANNDPLLGNYDVGYIGGSRNSLDEFKSNNSTDYYAARQDLGLHYLEMPVLLDYYAAPRLQLFAGAQFSMLLYASPDYTQGALLDFDDANFGDSQNGYYPQLASYNAVPLSKFDAAAVAGARWSLSKAWSLDFRYQFGVKDAIRGNDLGDFNRVLRVGMRFRFTSKP